MTEVRVTLTGPGTCRAVHGPSGVELATAAAPEFGGPGGGFSSTDLVAAALGTCVGSTIEPLIRREGIAHGAVELVVEKRLADAPRRIEELCVRIRVPAGTPEVVRTKVLRAAHACAVHRSLAATVSFDVVAG